MTDALHTLTLLSEQNSVQNLWGRPEGQVAIARMREGSLAIDAPSMS